MKTIIEIRHALLEYFAQENIINPVVQAKLVKFDCEDEALKIALVTEALEDLVKVDMVRRIEVRKEICRVDEPPVSIHYVLIKPLGMYEQTVSFGIDTLSAVAKVVNTYCNQVGNTKELVDTMNIKERDFQKLVMIAENFMPNNKESS